jgi:hypothetical protein
MTDAVALAAQYRRVRALEAAAARSQQSPTEHIHTLADPEALHQLLSQTLAVSAHLGDVAAGRVPPAATPPANSTCAVLPVAWEHREAVAEALALLAQLAAEAGSNLPARMQAVAAATAACDTLLARADDTCREAQAGSPLPEA